MAKKSIPAKSATAAKVVEDAAVEAPAEKNELTVVAQGALQTNLGAEILGDLQQDVDAGDQIKALTLNRGYLKRAARSKAAIGILHVMQNDDSFDGTDVYASEAKWRKAIAKLYVAFGIKTPDGKYTPEALVYFPNPSASDTEKETVDFKRRKSLRDNFGTLLKKSTRAAQAAFDKDMSLSFNPEKQTLRIENAPASIAGKGQKTVDLTGEKMKGASESASFEALMAIADKAHDPKYAEKQSARQSNVADVDALAHDAATSDKDLGALVNGLIVAMTGMNGQVKASQRKHLQNLYDHLADFLQNAKDV